MRLVRDITKSHNVHLGQTVWIIGAGPTLVESWDWEIPDGVVTIGMNSGAYWFWKYRDEFGRFVDIQYQGVNDLDDYRRDLHYWFCIDHKCLRKGKMPEWEYSNIAMRHPTASKFIRRQIPYPSECLNVDTFPQGNPPRSDPEIVTRQYPRRLYYGHVVLLPTLHWCYISGFKNIVLSGCDLCRYYKKDGNGVTRRFFEGYVKRVTGKRYRASVERAGRVTAPNGEQVLVDNMYRGQLNSVMRVIRYMQNNGVCIYKSSPRGMLDIPYLDYVDFKKLVINDSNGVDGKDEENKGTDKR